MRARQTLQSVTQSYFSCIWRRLAVK